MNIPIELCGYKGRLTCIFSRIAYPPWHKDDELLVNIEFDQPYPENVISTAISIPVKEYSRAELLKVVKKEGEKQIAEMLVKQREERGKATLRVKRREELETLAKRLEAKMS